MDLEIVTGKAVEILDIARGWLMTISTYIGRAIEVQPSNVYLVLLGLLSLYIAKKVFFLRYATIEGRGIWFWGMAAGIFAIFKFVGG